MALWDLRGKRADEPVWRLAGGAHDRLPLYDTEGGWIHLAREELVRNALAAKAAGLRGVKLKVGKPSLTEDAERLAAVRDAVGPAFEIMVDANQCFTGAEATRRGAPTSRSGSPGSRSRCRPTTSPGTSVSRVHDRPARGRGVALLGPARFAEYLAAGAAEIVQADAARVGGITPWLKVAHTASLQRAARAHFPMELHASLACAVPNGIYVEHIPQFSAITLRPTRHRGRLDPATGLTGIGILWDLDAIDDLRVA